MKYCTAQYECFIFLYTKPGKILLLQYKIKTLLSKFHYQNPFPQSAICLLLNLISIITSKRKVKLPLLSKYNKERQLNFLSNFQIRFWIKSGVFGRFFFSLSLFWSLKITLDSYRVIWSKMSVLQCFLNN